ncbi:IFI44-like protein [Mya arenaria]|uniref:IFI44-like protein n=1 Tax=Mya arenaria TaxID=6604 RepID=A0ABY7ESA6_MYAAR|nr:interferon-induced protein 44-like [Mya arenaria]XP_052817682.1 interferon-induced protein 44-like [Mya arenaria]WAR11284.1 IFI44-like protein [Mya arenaria]
MSTAWRNIQYESFEKAMVGLKESISAIQAKRLNVVLVGHTGAGKSCFINSICSISRGRIVNVASTRNATSGDVGTYQLTLIKSRKGELLQNVFLYDTMGFTGTFDDDEKGIGNEDLRDVCLGRLKKGHTFVSKADGGKRDTMKDTSAYRSSNAEEPENQCAADNDARKPHCVVFVVSAETLTQDTDTVIQKKLRKLYTYVPQDVAKIAVITKLDRVCDDVHKDIKNIFTSNEVQKAVKRAEEVFGLQENQVFPIVNFVSDMDVENDKGVPMLYALKFILSSALDRAEEREESSDEDD